MIPSYFLSNIYLPCPPKTSALCLLLSMTLYSMEYSFGQLVSTLLSSLKFLCTPNLLAEGIEFEKEKIMTLCKHCSAVAKALVCYQHCFSHKKQSTTSHRRKLTPSQTYPLHYEISFMSVNCPKI